MTDEARLSQADRDLACIAAATSLDGFLQEIAVAAHESGSAFTLGLLVNGMVILGMLAKPEQMAAALDAQRDVFVGMATKTDDVSDDEWAKRRERYATGSMLAVETMRDELAQLERDAAEQAGVDGLGPDTTPADVMRRAIFAKTHPHVTLRDARIFAPGQPGVTQVLVMRVAVSNIAGWWIVPTDGEGSSRFTPWSTNVPGLTFGDQ